MSRPPSNESLSDLPIRSIVGIAEVFDCVRDSKSKWAAKGAWHWLIRNARSIRPIQCTGRLGLWTPSQEVMKELPAWVTKVDRK